MIDEFSDHLIQAYLDDALSPSEASAFESLMRESEVARRRFWELAEIHGLAREAARVAWDESDLATSTSMPQATVRAPILTWNGLGRWSGALSTLTLGLIVGILTSSLAWGLAASQRDRGVELLHDSFETATPQSGGVPTLPGVWSGDQSQFCNATAGVQPHSGQQMLQILRADYPGKPNPGGYIGETYRLLDVGALRRDLLTGDSLVQVQAHFNALNFPDSERYLACVSVYALDHETAVSGTTRDALGLINQALATTQRNNVFLDRDPGTWQKIVAELRVPPQTDFLLVRISVAHATRGRERDHETFAGHFVDDVRATLVRRAPLP